MFSEEKEKPYLYLGVLLGYGMVYAICCYFASKCIPNNFQMKLSQVTQAKCMPQSGKIQNLYGDVRSLHGGKFSIKKIEGNSE